MKKLFNFIETDPLILFHYIPLIGVIIGWYFFSNWLGIMNIQDKTTQWLSIIGTLYLFLLIGDNLMHKLINKY